VELEGLSRDSDGRGSWAVALMEAVMEEPGCRPLDAKSHGFALMQARVVDETLGSTGPPHCETPLLGKEAVPLAPAVDFGLAEVGGPSRLWRGQI
jgi:hypothetical protein